MALFVVDIETTDLGFFPKNYPIEISIVKYDKARKHRVVYEQKVIQRSKEEFENSYFIRNMSDLTWKEVQKGKQLKEVAFEVSKILENGYLTSYNTEFDIYRMLDPILLNFSAIRSYSLLPCIMKYMKWLTKINHSYYGYKYPTLQESVKFLGIKKDRGFHLAKNDSIYTAKILERVFKNYSNKYKEYFTNKIKV